MILLANMATIGNGRTGDLVFGRPASTAPSKSCTRPSWIRCGYPAQRIADYALAAECLVFRVERTQSAVYHRITTAVGTDRINEDSPGNVDDICCGIVRISWHVP